MLEALSCECRAGVPWENLFAVSSCHCHHCRLLGRMCQKAADLEGGHGEEGAESERRKDQDYDLWYRTGPIAELRRVPMCHLPHWSRQKQHSMQWLQALGSQEMQWAQAPERGPQLQVIWVPRNRPAHRWKTKEGGSSDLTN